MSRVIKSFLFSALLFMSFMLKSQESETPHVNWVSVEEAQEKMTKEPRKMLIDFYTVWCGPCKMMTKNTFGNPVIAKYINENFYAVKFNSEGNAPVNYKGKSYSNPGYDPARSKSRNSSHEFSRAMGVSAYPTIAYFDEKLNMITPMPGYLDPKKMEAVLHFFVEETVYTQENFDKFMANFKGEL